MSARGFAVQAPIRFAGYAALFGRVDKGGDLIERGAFERTLATGRKIPLLWQHDPRLIIGHIESAREDKRGLRVIGALADGGSDAARLLTCGAVRGLSFGYRVIAAQGARPRRLIVLELVEVSLVTFPMMPRAKVHVIAPSSVLSPVFPA